MLPLFIETVLFTRLREKYLPDESFVALQAALMERPDLGAVVPGTGGVRKARWGRQGRGKRGGMRVIYYVRDREGVIWLLALYAKSERDNISPDLLRKMKDEIDA